MFPVRRPIHYLWKSQQFQQFRCYCCFKLSLNVFQCQGPCQKYLCNICVRTIVYVRICCVFCNNQQRLELKAVNLNKIEFVCPYTLDRHKILKSIQSFRDHCFSCGYMKQNDKQCVQRIQNYQCDQGHELVFLSEKICTQLFSGRTFFQIITQSQCYVCKQITIIRSYCIKCSKKYSQQIFYCSYCINLPASKTLCPIGHQLSYQNHLFKGMVCDCCGKKEIFLKRPVYSDKVCNFDICFECWDRLPNYNKLIPLRNKFNPQFKPIYQGASIV